MKFTVFGCWERISKFVTWLIIIIISVGAVAAYFCMEDKADTYIVATIYAAFLFLAGLYIASINNKTDRMIYRRKDYYLNLKKVKKLFETRGSLESDDEMRTFIISMKGFAGRGEGNPLSKYPVIRECGFVFTEEYLELEKQYYDQSENIHKDFIGKVNEYLKDNHIQTSQKYFAEMSLLETNYEEWCNHVIEDKDCIEPTIKYIYSLLEEKRTRLDEVECLRMKLKKHLDRDYLNLVATINRIENLYGDALQNLLYNDEQVLQAIDEIAKQIEDIASKMENVSDKMDDDIPENISREVYGLSEKIDTMQIAIVDEISSLMMEKMDDAF